MIFSMTHAPEKDNNSNITSSSLQSLEEIFDFVRRTYKKAVTVKVIQNLIVREKEN